MTQQQFNQTDPEKHPSQEMPGCGLASYGCLLFIFFMVGVLGLAVSSLSLMQASFEREPFSFSPGNQVKVWRLQPMRDAKLLELTEVPEWYHDESRDGTTACALNKAALLRLDGDDAWTVPFTAIEKVKSQRDGSRMVAIVTTKDQENIFCFFEPGEGVERFTRVLESYLE